MKKLSNTPTVYTTSTVAGLAASIRATDGTGRSYTPRPIGLYGLELKLRIVTAWKVFTGQWDALRWEEPTP